MDFLGQAAVTFSWLLVSLDAHAYLSLLVYIKAIVNGTFEANKQQKLMSIALGRCSSPNRETPVLGKFGYRIPTSIKFPCKEIYL